MKEKYDADYYFDLYNRLKSTVPLEEMAELHTTLKEKEGYLKGKCPFHKGREHSFTINPRKNIFYCFECNEGGDTLTFVAKINKCSQIEAIKILFDEPEKDSGEDSGK